MKPDISIHISHFLERFSGMRAPEKYVKDAFIEVVQSEIGITLDPEKMRISRDVLYVDDHPALKNEIFLHKERVQLGLQKKIGTKAPRDIL